MPTWPPISGAWNPFCQCMGLGSGTLIFLLSSRASCGGGMLCLNVCAFSMWPVATALSTTAFSQFIPTEDVCVFNIFQSQFLAMGNTTLSLNNVKNFNDSHTTQMRQLTPCTEYPWPSELGVVIPLYGRGIGSAERWRRRCNNIKNNNDKLYWVLTVQARVL